MNTAPFDLNLNPAVNAKAQRGGATTKTNGHSLPGGSISPSHDSATYDSAAFSVGPMKLLAESWVAESWGKQSFQENERVTDSRAKAQRGGTASKSLIVFLNAETQSPQRRCQLPQLFAPLHLCGFALIQTPFLGSIGALAFRVAVGCFAIAILHNRDKRRC